MSFSPYGSRLVSQSYNWDLVKLWDVAAGDCIASMDVTSAITGVSFDGDGISIILRDRGNKRQRWVLSYAHNPTHIDSYLPSPLPVVSVSIQDVETQLRCQMNLHIDITAIMGPGQA
jgi:WD40 repeat protein